MMTRNETIERIGAGLRREIQAIVQAPLSPRMLELVDKLDQLDPPPSKPPRADHAVLRTS
jgi:hypothetical protein